MLPAVTPVELRHAVVGYPDATIRVAVEAGRHRLLAGVD
jgi:hypothetical protein